MMTVFGAVISGGMVLMSRKKQMLSVLLLSGIVVWVNFANFRPFTYEFIDKYVPRDPCGTSWDFEYLPVSVRTCLKVPWEKPYRIASGDIEVSSFTGKPRALSLSARASRESVMQLAYYAYPGWRLRIDGKDASISDDNEHGLIEFAVSPGEHIVQATLEESPIERWSTRVSLVTALILFLSLVWGLVKFASTRTAVHKKV